jgi:putative nucleotidyltransferase with HDIG domain
MSTDHASNPQLNYQGPNMPVVTDTLRAEVRENLPEIEQIGDPELRRLVVEAWAHALAGSSFRLIREIPPAGNPGQLVLKRGSQTDHLRGVARLAMNIADEMIKQFPEMGINRDVVLAGALCHDVGKPWEFDPANRARWEAEPRKAGKPSFRHPAYGAHICLTVGLPEEIAHIAMAHSAEGELIVRSTECAIVHHADRTFWRVLAAGNMLKPETLPPGYA